MAHAPLPPDVERLLTSLLGQIQAVLGDFFLGMYVYGSLALGDFDPSRSDIDFLVATTGHLPDAHLAALRALHAQTAAGPSRWALDLECAYIPQSDLRRWDPAHARHPHLDRGSGTLTPRRHDSDWVVQRYSLRQHGICLAGPPIQTLIDPISPADLRQAMLDLLWWWDEQLADPHRVAQSGYQAYAILSMCRVLYTMHHGDITTKPRAARWAQTGPGAPWASLIESALHWQPGQPLDRLDETLDWIRFTLAECRRLHSDC